MHRKHALYTRCHRSFQLESIIDHHLSSTLSSSSSSINQTHIKRQSLSLNYVSKNSIWVHLLFAISILLLDSSASSALRLSEASITISRFNGHQPSPALRSLTTDQLPDAETSYPTNDPTIDESAVKTEFTGRNEPNYARRALELNERVTKRNVPPQQDTDSSNDSVVARSVGSGRDRPVADVPNELIDSVLTVAPSVSLSSSSSSPAADRPQASLPSHLSTSHARGASIIPSTQAPLSSPSPPSTSSATSSSDHLFNQNDNLVNDRDVDRTQVNSRIKDTLEWSEPARDSYRNNQSHPIKHVELAKFDFDHVSTPYVISLWIIIVGLAKIGKSIDFV